jgi:hypothetical protein
MRATKTLIGAAVSVAAVASLAGTAGARIPDGKMVDNTQPQSTLSFSGFNLGMDLPSNAGLSSIDSWISDQMMRRVASLEAKFEGPDAAARAIARRDR